MVIDTKQIGGIVASQSGGAGLSEKLIETIFPVAKKISFDLEGSRSKKLEDGSLLITVPLHLAFGDIKTPKSAYVNFKNTESKYVPVHWDFSKYDSEEIGAKTFHPVMEYGYWFPDNVKIPSVTIDVQDFKEPVSYYKFAYNKMPQKAGGKDTNGYNLTTQLTTNVLNELKKNVKTTYVSTSEEMFAGCEKLRSLPELGQDFSKVEKANKMFYRCMALTAIPDEYLNLPSVKSITGMFDNVTGIQKFNFSALKLDSLESASDLLGGLVYKDFEGELNLPSMKKLTSLGGGGNGNLKKLPVVNLPVIEDLSGAFKNVYAENWYGINAPMATNCSSMCEGDYHYPKRIEMLNLPNATTYNSAFKNCWELEYLPPIDLTHVTDVKDMLYACKALKEARFKNVPSEMVSQLTKENLDSAGTGIFEIVIENTI